MPHYPMDQLTRRSASASPTDFRFLVFATDLHSCPSGSMSDTRIPNPQKSGIPVSGNAAQSFGIL